MREINLLSRLYVLSNAFAISGLRSDLDLTISVAAQIEAVRHAKVDDEDGDGDVIDIDNDPGLLGIQCVFPRPIRSSWRPRSMR